MLQYTLQTAGENQRVLFQSSTARNPEVETAVDFFGCSELIIFPIELHDSNSTLFGGEGFISGYDWAYKFYFNSKTRLSTAK